MRRLIVLVTLSLTTLGLVALGGAAQATFPGPNGRIAFLTAKGVCCNISTMEPDGSDVRQLTHEPDRYGAFNASWSPDDSLLAFSRQKIGGRTFTSQLWV